MYATKNIAKSGEIIGIYLDLSKQFFERNVHKKILTLFHDDGNIFFSLINIYKICRNSRNNNQNWGSKKLAKMGSPVFFNNSREKFGNHG